jgi:hypothetical protein
MFTRCGKLMEHDKRGGVEGVGRGKREADDTTRVGRGWMTQGKQAADNTTRGLSLQWQKMVEAALFGCQRVSTPSRISHYCAGRRSGGDLS